MPRRSLLIAFSILTAVSACLISCATSSPNDGRILLAINVTPPSTDGTAYPNGLATFTASGTFSVVPSPAPIGSAAPYYGQFVVDNPTSGPIANIVSTGNSTATVQCVTGAAGTVGVSMTADANNGTSTIVSGTAQFTCP